MNLRPYLITFSANGRSQVDMEVPRRTPELCAEEMESPFQDPGHRTSPPRVQESDSPLFGVHNKYRHAVCHRHPKEDPPGSGEVAIRLRAEPETGCPGVREFSGSARMKGEIAVMERHCLSMDLP